MCQINSQRNTNKYLPSNIDHRAWQYHSTNLHYAVDVWRHTSSHTQIFSVLVHALRAYIFYTRILHSHNTGLRHNARVGEPNSALRRDSGGVRAMCSQEVTHDFYTVSITAAQFCFINFFIC